MRAAICALLVVLLLPRLAVAEDARRAAARECYQRGRVAYESGDFQRAYDQFKEAYVLSHEPALLYNIANALERLRRPQEAAEAFRSYLRLQPEDAERAGIERRADALDEEARLISREPGAHPAPRTAEGDALIVPPSFAEPSASPALIAPPLAPARARRRKVIIAVVTSLAAASAAALAIGLGVGLSGRTESPTPADIGPLSGTR
jgi:tetratricopeptide (TPR) repeat protein